MKKNTLLPLVFHLPWYQIPPGRREAMMAEMAGWGVKELVAPQYFHQADYPEAGGYVGAMARWAESKGLRFTAAHGLLGPEYDLGWAGPEALREHGRYLRDLAAVGVKTYTVHSGTNQVMFQPVPPVDFWDRVRRAVEVLLPVAVDHQVVLTLENIYESRPHFVRLVDVVREFDHPNVRMCLDTGHANISPVRLTEVFRSMSPYVATCHLHDNHGTQDEHGAPGRGNVPWEELIPKLKGVPGLIHGETEAKAFSEEIWQDYQAIWRLG